MDELEDQSPVPGGTTAIRGGQYVTEERAPGPPSPDYRCPADGYHYHTMSGGGVQYVPPHREIDVKRLTAALVELEESKISQHPECMSDTCDHDECPDWGCLGCGDAPAIAAIYAALGEEPTP